MKKNDLTLLQNIIKQTKFALNNEVHIGVPKDVGEYKNGQRIVEVGIRHEHGLGVPRRSFLRMPFIVKQAEINKQINISWEKIISGKSTAIKELGVLGILGQNISKEAFATGGFGKWEKLNPKTIKAKGSNEILIDKAKLVQSVTNWVVAK